MNARPNPPEWNRLVDAARRAANDTTDASAPYGFATRIAAQAMAAKRGDSVALGRLSMRALGVSCLLMIASVAANISPILHAVEEEAAALGDTTTTETETIELS